ncbi:MAG: ornithine aminotransferase, rocD2 [Pseudomonadota bacterium]
MKKTETNAAWMSRLMALECHDATYPVSADANPLVFESGTGSIIRDVEGRAYVDLCAGFGALALGHNPAVVREVFGRYAGADFFPIAHGMGDVYPSRSKIELIEELRSVLPSRLSRISLAISGGQAIEVALKTAMLKTDCAGFICFKDGYHGVDLGVLPVTSRSDFKKPFSKYLCERVAIELPYGCDSGLIVDAMRTLQAMPCGFAGIIAEPVQGRGGVINPPKGWLRELAGLAHQQRGVLILDEILTGLGRRGKWTEADVVDADLVCFGKALGGGMPLSACAGTEEVMSAWPKSTGEAIHTGTFFGHPLSCAVATASLREMKRIDACKMASETGAWLYQELQLKYEKDPRIEEIRWGGGLMLAIKFHESAGSAPGAVAMDVLRCRGVIALASGSGGTSLSLTPALNIPRESLIHALAFFDL